jgi:hypothetical protein
VKEMRISKQSVVKSTKQVQVEEKVLSLLKFASQIHLIKFDDPKTY